MAHMNKKILQLCDEIKLLKMTVPEALKTMMHDLRALARRLSTPPPNYVHLLFLICRLRPLAHVRRSEQEATRNRVARHARLGRKHEHGSAQLIATRYSTVTTTCTGPPFTRCSSRTTTAPPTYLRLVHISIGDVYANA